MGIVNWSNFTLCLKKILHDMGVSLIAISVITSVVNAAPTVELSYVSSFGKAPSRAPGQMNYPSAVAVDQTNGDFYVMDVLFHRVQKFRSDGTYVTQWKSVNGLGISIDNTTNNVYVASPGDNVIRKYDSSGTLLLEWGSKGTGKGEFRAPRDVAVHPITGDVYVLDEINLRVQVFDDGGNYLFEWVGPFHKPYALNFDPSGILYVANAGGATIEKFDDKGKHLATWGNLGSDPGQFRWPRGIDTDGDGNIYVADSDMERVQKLNDLGEVLQVIQGPHNFKDGPFHPRDVAVDRRTGEYYVAAAYAFRIDKFDPKGNFMWSIGKMDRDGEFLNLPKGIAIDPTNGDVIVADTFNHLIKRFSKYGSFLAQYGASAPIDRSLRYLGFPSRIDINQDGNIIGLNGGVYYPDNLQWGSDEYVRTFDPTYKYISGFANADLSAGMFGLDVENKTNNVLVSIPRKNKIIKFDESGTVIFEVGAQGAEDGNFRTPAGVAVDKLTGDFYVVDSGNQRIQKFTKDGDFLLAWGSAGSDPSEFKFSKSSDIEVDGDGLVYVADTGNSRIQIFDLDGSYIASLGEFGWGGPGEFAWPASVAVSEDNILYILDTGGKEVEIYNITKSGVYDRDLDGIADVWELENFQTLSRDGNGDYDNDGLTDKLEYDVGLDPTSPDMDYVAETETSNSDSAPEIQSGGGGGCSLQKQDSSIDPVLPLLIFWSLFYLMHCRRGVREAKNENNYG